MHDSLLCSFTAAKKAHHDSVGRYPLERELLVRGHFPAELGPLESILRINFGRHLRIKLKKGLIYVNLLI
jgi:hypothetical protein